MASRLDPAQQAAIDRMASERRRSVVAVQEQIGFGDGIFMKEMLGYMLEYKVVSTERAAELLSRPPNELHFVIHTDEWLDLMVKLGMYEKPQDFWRTHRSRNEILKDLFGWKLENDRKERVALESASNEETLRRGTLLQPLLAEHPKSQLERVMATEPDPVRARRASLVMLASIIPVSAYAGDHFGTRAEGGEGYTDGLMYALRTQLKDEEGRKEAHKKQAAAEKEGGDVRTIVQACRDPTGGITSSSARPMMSAEDYVNGLMSGDAKKSNTQDGGIMAHASGEDANCSVLASSTSEVPGARRTSIGNNALADHAKILEGMLSVLSGDWTGSHSVHTSINEESTSKAPVSQADSEVHTLPPSTRVVTGAPVQLRAQHSTSTQSVATRGSSKSEYKIDRRTAAVREEEERLNEVAMLAVLNPRRTPGASVNGFADFVCKNASSSEAEASELSAVLSGSPPPRGLGAFPRSHSNSRSNPQLNMLARFGVSFKDLQFADAMLGSTAANLVDRMTAAVNVSQVGGVEAVSVISPAKTSPEPLRLRLPREGHATDEHTGSGLPPRSGGASTPSITFSFQDIAGSTPSGTPHDVKSCTPAPSPVPNDGVMVGNTTMVHVPLDRAPTKADLYFQPVDPTVTKTVLTLPMMGRRQSSERLMGALGSPTGVAGRRAVTAGSPGVGGTGLQVQLDGRAISRGKWPGSPHAEMRASSRSPSRSPIIPASPYDVAVIPDHARDGRGPRFGAHGAPTGLGTIPDKSRSSALRRTGSAENSMGMGIPSMGSPVAAMASLASLPPTSPSSAPGTAPKKATGSSGARPEFPMDNGMRGHSLLAAGATVLGSGSSGPAAVALHKQAALMGATPLLAALGLGYPANGSIGQLGGQPGRVYAGFGVTAGDGRQKNSSGTDESEDGGNPPPRTELFGAGYAPQSWGVMEKDGEYPRVAKELEGLRHKAFKDKNAESLAKTYSPGNVASMGRAWGITSEQLAVKKS